MTFALVAAVGIVAGMFFNVFVLSGIAAVLVTMASLLGAAAGFAHPFAQALALSFTLQGGYFVGILSRQLGWEPRDAASWGTLDRKRNRTRAD